MIKLIDIAADCFDSLNFEIKDSCIYKIIGNSNTELKVLIEVILSIKKPYAGKVFIFNEDIFALSNQMTLKLLSRIGVIWRYGGLISNLKVWENIILPMNYSAQSTKSITEQRNIEERIINIFKQLGFEEDYLPELMGKIPAQLTIYEKKTISIIRSILMDPDIMIYDSLFHEIEQDKIKNITDLLIKFHNEKNGRISIFLSDKEESLSHIEGKTIKLKKIYHDN